MAIYKVHMMVPAGQGLPDLPWRVQVKKLGDDLRQGQASHFHSASPDTVPRNH